MAVRTPRISAHGKIERGELHIHHDVVPRRRLATFGCESWGGLRRLLRAERPWEESLERIATNKKIDRAVSQVFWIADDRLFNQLNPFTHRREGGFGGGEGPRRLPSI